MSIATFVRQFFHRGEKKQRPMQLSINPKAIGRKPEPVNTDEIERVIDQAIDQLKAELKAVKTAAVPKVAIVSKPYQPSPIVQAMKDINQRKKYWNRSLEPWQVSAELRSIDMNMMLRDYSKLFDTVMSNNIQNMYDLDRLESGTRAYILEHSPDEVTLNKIIAKCGAISFEVYPLKGHTREQRIHQKLKSLFRP